MFFVSWPGHKKKHFLLNIFWGVAIAGVLHFAHSTGIGHSIFNNAYDFLVQKDFKLNVAKAENSLQLPFSDAIRFVTFDRATYKESPGGFNWTPKDLLGKSIYKAVTLGARVVVVDFAVQNKAPVYCSAGECHDDNGIFLDELENAVKYISNSKLETVILLGWLLSPDEEEGNQQQTVCSVPESQNEYLNRLKNIVTKSNGIIRFGSSGSFTSTVDYKIRHYQFYQDIISSEDVAGENDKLFSIQLMAVVYYWYGRARGAELLKELGEQLHGDSGRGVIKYPDGQQNPDEPQVRLYAVYQQDATHLTVESRYLFRVAPDETIKRVFPDSVVNTEALAPGLAVTPRSLLQLPEGENTYSSSIVLLGSTTPDLGDFHHTPIGDMSGVYLQANGINQILAGLQLHNPSKMSVIIFEIVIIVITAYIFLVLNPFLAGVTLLGLIYMINTPISLYLFHRFGIIMDYWVPLVGIGLHEFISNMEDTVGRILRKKQ